MTVFLVAASLVVALPLAAAFSPTLCRYLAAALLTHADTVESARRMRSESWRRYLYVMQLETGREQPRSEART